MLRTHRPQHCRALKRMADPDKDSPAPLWYHMTMEAAGDLDFIDIIQTSFPSPDKEFKKIRSRALKLLKVAQSECDNPDARVIISDMIAELEGW
jgi:hypothetical protein